MSTISKQSNLTHIPTQSLVIFAHVANTMNLTKSAQQLNMSKAAVSKHIRHIENIYKIDFFTREKQRLKLTAEGEALLENIMPMLSALQHTQNILTSMQQQPTGTLTISVGNQHVSQTLLLNVLCEYTHLFPDIRIKCLHDQQIHDLIDDGIDIVFGINWTPPDYVVALPLHTTRYVLCASPKYLEQHGIPANPTELLKHHYIPHANRTDEHLPLSTHQQKILLNNSRIILNHSEMLRYSALAGLGIVNLHYYTVATDISNGRLIEILPEHSTSVTLMMYYTKHCHTQPKVKAFVDLVKKYLTNEVIQS